MKVDMNAMIAELIINHGYENCEESLEGIKTATDKIKATSSNFKFYCVFLEIFREQLLKLKEKKQRQ